MYLLSLICLLFFSHQREEKAKAKTKEESRKEFDGVSWP
ncbi:hypothetical protein ACJIZ3_005168 [Penstemon smallii]|uniref:Uncharacterized protein n=1 Tax=Penstemon smallii TaxID=265156 RepID=A0ABD3S452_9LAMI